MCISLLAPCTGSAIGNIVIANLFATFIYEQAAKQQQHNGTDVGDGGVGADASGGCLGPACYAPTHEAIVAACALTAMNAAILAVRSRKIYARDGLTAAQ